MKQLQRFETKPLVDDDWKLSDVKGTFWNGFFLWRRNSVFFWRNNSIFLEKLWFFCRKDDFFWEKRKRKVFHNVFPHSSQIIVPVLELGALKRQLINCTTPNAIRKLLVKCTNLIMSSDPPLSMEPWHINTSWIIPISIKSVLTSLPRGFLQDFGYICIAKAKSFAAEQVSLSSDQ